MFDHHTVPRRTREALRVALGPRREDWALRDTARPFFVSFTETMFASGRFQEYLVDWPILGSDPDLERDYLGYRPLEELDLEETGGSLWLYRRLPGPVAGREYPRFLAELEIGDRVDRVWIPTAADLLRFLAELPLVDRGEHVGSPTAADRLHFPDASDEENDDDALRPIGTAAPAPVGLRRGA